MTSAATNDGHAQLIDIDGRRALRVDVHPRPAGDIKATMRATEVALRALSAETLLRPAGIGEGFRIEDLVTLEVSAPRAQHDDAQRWWRRRLIPEVSVTFVDDDVVSAHAVFVERGAVPTSQRTTYARDDSGRVRVEAFELHVVEHCNLKCAHCCNMSPYMSAKTLSPQQIADTLARMGEAIHADVFKIMGGEPLLHPNITEVLRVVRKSGIGDVVRLFTNGLLLHKMDDDFWRALDHLTVSSYDSAPVTAEHRALIEEKARAFDVVLNVKPVDAFSQVMFDEQRHDDDAVKDTYQRCWLRHRCLIARDGRFFACTRSAYLNDMHERIALHEPFADPQTKRDEDSVPLDHPDLPTAIAALLSREQPLHACRFCLGGDGPRERHRQLSRDDVRRGSLRVLPMAA